MKIFYDENSTSEQKKEALKRIGEAEEAMLRMYEECERIIDEARKDFEDASIAHPDSNTENEVGVSKKAFEEFLRNKSLVELNVQTVQDLLQTLNKGFEIAPDSIEHSQEADGDYTITGDAIREYYILGGEIDYEEAVQTYGEMGAVIRNGSDYTISTPTQTEQENENDGR